MKTIFEYYSTKEGKVVQEEVHYIRVGENLFRCPSGGQKDLEFRVKRFAFFRVSGKTPEEIRAIMQEKRYAISVVDLDNKILHIPEFPVSDHFFLEIKDGEEGTTREEGIMKMILKTLVLSVMDSSGTSSTSYTFHEETEKAIKAGRFEIKEPVKMTSHHFVVKDGKTLDMFYWLKNKTGESQGVASYNLSNGTLDFSQKAHEKFVRGRIIEAAEVVKKWVAKNNSLITRLNVFLKSHGIKEEVASGDLSCLELPVSFTPFVKKVKEIIEGNKPLEELEAILRRWEPGFRNWVLKKKDAQKAFYKASPKKPVEKPVEQGETDPEIINRYLDNGNSNAKVGEVAIRPLTNKETKAETPQAPVAVEAPEIEPTTINEKPSNDAGDTEEEGCPLAASAK
uniref:Uncharacterized protein n=1 Tax=candidate division CPR3 bacterium TaxID=2268181 RepID=A0A7C4R401_UNCC3